MNTKIPPSAVAEQIWDFVDPFICPINHIPHLDKRDPPGDFCGTGWFIEKAGIPHLCTCEHVAWAKVKGQFAYACLGSDFGISVGSEFVIEPHPIDFAIANLSLTWAKLQHIGKCIPRALLASHHCPVEGEYLYVQGFPSVDSKPLIGQHNVKPIGGFLHQVEQPPEVENEKPKVDPEIHICMAWSPANATPMLSTKGWLPVANGLSGSVLWNTGYKEATENGRQWTIDDVRITGIVWAVSSKGCVIIATPIERLLPFL